jgi:hypothetical protein
MIPNVKQIQEGFQFNPTASVVLERNEGEPEAFKIRAPIRNERLRVSSITHVSEPELFAALMMRQIAQAKNWPHSFPAPLQTRLIELGLLVSAEQISRPVRFDCDLNAQLMEFLPRRSHISFPNIPNGALLVNPALRFLGSSDTVNDNSILKSCFRQLRADRFWYQLNPQGQAPGIYSFTKDEQEILQTLIGGKTSGDLDREWLKLLVQAGILIKADGQQEVNAQASERLDAAKTHLKNYRYVILKSILHPFQLAAIRRYYRRMVAEGYFSFGDEEWPLRYFAGNDLIGRFYHEQMTSLISNVIGESVYPTFTFFASYRPGAILPPHRDREECEFSISLLLDFIPEPADECPWPIFVESPKHSNQSIPVHLGIGDLLLYRGRELRHYRNAFQEGEASTTWLFFYEPTANQTEINPSDK